VSDEMLVLYLDIGVQLLALLHGMLYYDKWARGEDHDFRKSKRSSEKAIR
jgi:hypothetical protein